MAPGLGACGCGPHGFSILKVREVHDAKNNEAHGAMKKERHVCARRRVGEAAVSS